MRKGVSPQPYTGSAGRSLAAHELCRPDLLPDRERYPQMPASHWACAFIMPARPVASVAVAGLLALRALHMESSFDNIASSLGSETTCVKRDEASPDYCPTRATLGRLGASAGVALCLL